MRRGTSSCLIALGCALVVALTGCRLTGGVANAGPPPGGWPQPAGSRVTKEMCGLLTKADYAQLGHDRQPNVTDAVNDHENTVDCQYKSTDDMTLTLEPTADFAHYVFAAGLKDHKHQLTEGHRQPALASGVVGAADESWFDYWTLGTAEARPVAHELRLRRGGLILGITLSGVRGKKEKDPRSVLIALADLVLRRLPHVGAKDTGTAHKIQYGAIGPGKAKSIQWEDYTGIQGAGEVGNTRLPWLHTVPMASEDGVQPSSPSLRVEASSPSAKVGCVIVIDNVPVAAKKPTKGFADCQGEFPDTSAGSPPSAGQPASFRQGPSPA
jgi:hypothetical protein